MKYLVGADIGTTSLKMTLFNEALEPVRSAVRDYTLKVTGDRIEFPADQYWKLFLDAYEEITEGVRPAAVSVDTQCETLIVTDAEGNPLRDAIVWLDKRAAAQADRIKEHFGCQRVYNITGQPDITAIWPACKLSWLRENEPDLFSSIRRIFLLEDWILYKMTGEFVTEMTLQSSTIYFDIRREQWWQEMLDYIGIEESMLPQLLSSGMKVGAFRGAAVVTSAIDQIAGAIGAGVTDRKTISEMTGTTMVLTVPLDSMPPYDPKSIIPCHKNYNGKFCLLSWTPTAGMALKWFRNQFCEGYSFQDLDILAEAVPPGSDGLTFLPYLCGSVMPKYNPDVRGAFYGLTLEHGRGHAVRAILESVACMLRENLDYMGSDCSEIRSMGGGASSPLWCQIKADMTGRRVTVLKNAETACLGSAILAGKGIGLFESVEETARKAAVPLRTYTPGRFDYTDCYKRFCEWEEKVL